MEKEKIKIEPRQQGKFTSSMRILIEWIFRKEPFQYHSPDFVVVGMTREAWEKILKNQKSSNNGIIFQDELKPLK